MKHIILIDPPSGWKYGFPKIMLKSIFDRISMTELISWIVTQGYPLSEVTSLQDSFYVQITELPMSRVYIDFCLSFWSKLDEKIKIELLQDFGGDPNHFSEDDIIEIVSDYWYRESVIKDTDIPNDESFD
jgi:hypothetical protein